MSNEESRFELSNNSRAEARLFRYWSNRTHPQPQAFERTLYSGTVSNPASNITYSRGRTRRFNVYFPFVPSNLSMKWVSNFPAAKSASARIRRVQRDRRLDALR